MPFIDLDAVSFDPEIRLLVPEEICRRYQLLPFKLEGREVAVAIGEMLNVEGERLVEYLTGKHVTPYFAFQDQIEARIREYYAGEAGSSPDTGGEATPYTLRIQGERSGETGSPIVDLVNRIIGEAIHREASDIHIEPKENKVVVRIRVDGVLRNLMEIPKENQQAVVSRIKIISNLDIADSRRPQDGKAKVVYNDHNIDLRVSTVPTNLGEKVVIRILDSRKAKVSFEQLGVRGRNLELLEQCFSFKEGMVLVTGPTGSGKSTTLYAALNRLRSTTNNIMTIEDPVEYRLEGINQVQVNEKAGVTFAAALRSFLRQDPDVILVGEIRDRETAEIAVQAALTGHLVLSTLHTNDAFATLTRLMDMGVDAVKAGEAIQAVIAQRLVRRLCPQCRLETEPDEMEKKLIPLMKRLNCEPRFFRARGCPHCGFTGYKGRTGVYEILILDNDLKAMILRQAPLYEVRKAAREKGFRNLYEDALNLISEGITDYREVLRVIHPDSDQAVELEAME
ncbi:MAG: type II/IV secretion system protein, partial [Calditrichaeota bacterium]